MKQNKIKKGIIKKRRNYNIFQKTTTAKFPEISHFFNLHDSSLGRHVNAASRKRLEIQAYSITKPRTLLKRKFV